MPFFLFHNRSKGALNLKQTAFSQTGALKPGKRLLTKISINKLVVVVLLLVHSFLLSSCTNLIAASRSGPIVENYGTRTTGARVDDGLIETKARVNLKKIDQRFSQAQIDVDSHNGVVLLTGNVSAADMRNVATQTLEKIRKVRRVHNELVVSPPRSYGAKLGDAWLSRKVKTRLLFNKHVQSRRLQIVTEDGVIYLMGLVTRNEADKIVEVVKKAYGLQKIVRIFEYID